MPVTARFLPMLLTYLGLETPVVKSGLLPVFLMTGYNSAVPRTSSCLINCYSSSQNSNILIPRLLGYYKKAITQEQPVVEMGRAKCGERMLSIHALFRCTPLSTSPSVHQPEALWTLSFWVIMEASLHRHNQLNHWPPASDSSSSPSCLLGGHGVGLKGPTLLKMWLATLATSPDLSFQKSPY